MIDDAFRAQYEAATRGSGVVRLPLWTTVRIAGKDRASFLHNMCTNDIRGVPVGGQCEAFLTDVKGKIVGHVIVLVGPDDILLITVPEQAEKLIAHLDRYIIREDVQLSNESGSIEWSLHLGGAQVGRSVGGIVRTAPCTHAWPGGYWLGVATNTVFTVAGEVECDERVWQTIRIESGWPLYGVDFDGSNLPQEVGRNEQAISFRKGCYLGQETVARIDALGHVNKRLVTVRFEGGGTPESGVELRSGDVVVGKVTSAGWSPAADAAIALAMVRRGHNDLGSKLKCGDNAAIVVPTPLVHVKKDTVE